MGEHNSLSVSQILARVRDEDSAIIQSLLNSLGAQTHPYLITMGLEEGEIEEVIFDAMTLFIRKVQKGDYLDQGSL